MELEENNKSEDINDNNTISNNDNLIIDTDNNINNNINNDELDYDIEKQKEKVNNTKEQSERSDVSEYEIKKDNVNSDIKKSNLSNIDSKNLNDNKMKQKNITILKNLKNLLCNICKINAVFKINSDYTIEFYREKECDLTEYLIQINDIQISSKISLYDIYINILELYSDNYDFNICLIYGKEDEQTQAAQNQCMHSQLMDFISGRFTVCAPLLK